jgi:hypothetical protein
VSAILIISIFLLFVASFSLIRSKRSQSQDEAGRLPPEPQYRGLFGERHQNNSDEVKTAAAEAARNAAAERRASLRARASAGELAALLDAREEGEAALYRELLDLLVERAASDPLTLWELSGFIIRSEVLRASPLLTERLLESWREGATLSSTAGLLRIAALSDDAKTFERAVEEIFRVWDEERLPDISASDLSALFESEYWLLSSDAKRSGAGFVLKGTLNELRRRLLESARPENPPSEKADREKASQ